MDPQIPTGDSQGFVPVEVVSYSDLDWAGCQRSRRSTSGSLITCSQWLSHQQVVLRRQYPIQAQHFIKELKSALLSRCENHTQDRFISRQNNGLTSCNLKKSNHIELRHLRIQDVLSEGIMSLEKVGTHHHPSDVLTKFVQASEAQPFQRSFSVSGVQVLLKCREGQDSRY